MSNTGRILRAWAVTIVISFVLLFILAILMAEPDPATRDTTTTVPAGVLLVPEHTA